MASKVFSIIIPAYKAERRLVECLESCLNQDFSLPYEVIVIVGESEDKTAEIALSYGTGYPDLFKVFVGKNLGASKARWKGIKEAKGSYIAFLDSDDYYRKDYLSTFYREIEKGDYDVVISSHNIVREKKTRRTRIRLNKEVTGEKAQRMLLNDAIVRGYLWNKVFKRELFFDKPLIVYNGQKVMFEDWALLASLFQYAKKVKFIKDPLYYYRKTDPSCISSFNPMRFIYYLETLGRVRYFLDTYGSPKALRSFFRSWPMYKFTLWLYRHQVNERLENKKERKANDLLCRDAYKRLMDKKKALDLVYPFEFLDREITVFKDDK